MAKQGSETQINLGPSSRLKESDLQSIRNSFPLPEGYFYRLPTNAERAPQAVSSGVPVHRASLEFGFRFPLPDFGVAFLQHYDIVPAQLHPHGWAQVIGFTIICHKFNVMPTVPLFNSFFRVRSVRNSTCFCIQKVSERGQNNRLFGNPPSKLYNYASDWLIVEIPLTLDIPTHWCLHGPLNLSQLSNLRDLYGPLITQLQVDDENTLLSLLTSENVAAAGWGCISIAPISKLEPTCLSSSPEGSQGIRNPNDSSEEDFEENLDCGQGEAFGNPFLDLHSDESLTNIHFLDDYQNSGMHSLRRAFTRWEGNENATKVARPHKRRCLKDSAQEQVGETSSRDQAWISIPPSQGERSRSPIALSSRPEGSSSRNQDKGKQPAVDAKFLDPKLEEYDRNNRVECNTTRPSRTERRILYVESAMKDKPTLPQIVELNTSQFQVDGKEMVHGQNFVVCPGVNDNDSIHDPGVASRLGWSTILPRDEAELFKDLPHSEDRADYLAMRAAQQVIASNARYRTYKAQVDAELHQLRAEKSGWLTERNQYKKFLEQLERLKKGKEDLNLENLRLQENFAKEQKKSEQYKEAYTTTCEELNSFKSNYDSVLSKFQDLETSYDELKSDHKRLADRNQEMEEEISSLQREPQSSSINQDVRDRIRSEAVREYRLSQDCHDRKLLFSTSFVKYGFYMARSWLEKERSGETFPELQWSRQLERYTSEFRGWTDYEPDSENFETYMENGAYDDLSNLSGPWEPRQQQRVIDALGDLDCDDSDSSNEGASPPAKK